MIKPLIGLTSIPQKINSSEMNTVFDSEYKAIIKAGGIPIILPITEDKELIEYYSEVIEGILFTGGHDIAPKEYNAEPTEYIKELTHNRDRMELQLFKYMYLKDKPILGICRGLQLINTALGGTLYQNIGTEVKGVIGHVFPSNTKEEHHTITIKPDTLMYSIYNREEIMVNSVHHQSIKGVGEGLKITSRAKDGIIESVESTTDRFILGVQYHPEDLSDKNYNHSGVFKLLVQESIKRRD